MTMNFIHLDLPHLWFGFAEAHFPIVQFESCTAWVHPEVKREKSTMRRGEDTKHECKTKLMLETNDKRRMTLLSEGTCTWQWHLRQLARLTDNRLNQILLCEKENEFEKTIYDGSDCRWWLNLRRFPRLRQRRLHRARTGDLRSSSSRLRAVIADWRLAL